MAEPPREAAEAAAGKAAVVTPRLTPRLTPRAASITAQSSTPPPYTASPGGGAEQLALEEMDEFDDDMFDEFLMDSPSYSC